MSCIIQPVGSPFTFIPSDLSGNTITSFNSGSGYLKTGATGGFLYVPAMSGAPNNITGPTGYTGAVAMCFDRINNTPWYLNTNNTFAGSTGPSSITWLPGNGMVLIATRILTVNTATLTISVPSVFNNLILIGVGRTTQATTFNDLLLRMNADATATNYWYQRVRSSNATTLGAAANAAVGIAQFPGTSINVSCAGNFICTIFEYNSPFFKKFSSVSGINGLTAANSSLQTVTGQWNNTTAITSITLLMATSSIATNSRIRLYGVY